MTMTETVKVVRGHQLVQKSDLLGHRSEPRETGTTLPFDGHLCSRTKLPQLHLLLPLGHLTARSLRLRPNFQEKAA